MKTNMILAAIITIMITAGTYLAVQRSSILPENAQLGAEPTSESESQQAANIASDNAVRMDNALDAINQKTIDGKVKASLIASSKVSGLAIDVEKKDAGHILLEGYVLQPEEKAYAQSIALQIDGVDKVTNKLEIDQSVGVDEAYQTFPTRTMPNSL